jgi:membrane-associated phospholipid phosphatase
VGYLQSPLAQYANISVQAGYRQIPDLVRLRSGTGFSLAVGQVRGMVTFPSFHTCTGVLLIWALWPLRVLRWPVALLNLLMFGSIPVVGGHYLLDVPGGMLVSAMAIAITKRAMRARAPQTA